MARKFIFRNQNEIKKFEIYHLFTFKVELQLHRTGVILFSKQNKGYWQYMESFWVVITGKGGAPRTW